MEGTKRVFHPPAITELDLCTTQHKMLQLTPAPVMSESNKNLVIDNGGKRGSLFICTSQSFCVENNPKL